MVMTFFYFLASITLRSTVSNQDVNKGGRIELKWEITKNAGENYILATIKLVPPGKTEINVAVFLSEFKIQTYPDYSKRGWTVSHASGSLQIVLDIKNAQEVDDGVYTLEMHYTGSNGPVSDKLGIRLNVLGKMKTFSVTLYDGIGCDLCEDTSSIIVYYALLQTFLVIYGDAFNF